MSEREGRIQGDLRVRVAFTSILISRSEGSIRIPKRIKDLKNLAYLMEFKYHGEVRYEIQ